MTKHATIGHVSPAPVPHDPRDVVGDGDDDFARAMGAAFPTGKRLAFATTRIVRREPTLVALNTAHEIRYAASVAFADLCGVKYDSDRCITFGMLLAYRRALSILVRGDVFADKQTHDAIRAIEAEIDSAVKWAIAAGAVTR